jgi:hypothetical protein
MTREEFVEKVDDAYSSEYFKSRDWMAAMGVAVDIVLEEAANACAPHSDDDKLDRQAKAECATAIRALKGECDES